MPTLRTCEYFDHLPRVLINFPEFVPCASGGVMPGMFLLPLFLPGQLLHRGVPLPSVGKMALFTRTKSTAFPSLFCSPILCWRGARSSCYANSVSAYAAALFLRQEAIDVKVAGLVFDERQRPDFLFRLSSQGDKVCIWRNTSGGSGGAPRERVCGERRPVVASARKRPVHEQVHYKLPGLPILTVGIPSRCRCREI